ncbi:CHAT domain-containing protein [Desulfococcaceae bacterium HSG8]|nr:CHAT domain-containing protein [Desulfococcaceae bacterium HSG8]
MPSNYRRILSALTFFMILELAVFLCSAHAQIITDGTVGTAASLSGPDYQIGADLGKQAGGNLFHSFDTFNINTHGSAIFTGPDSVENIISRVTGGSSSRIDGLLHSEIQGADFFLLNPAGVMFGPNASLDISGSFHVSTANYLRLGEDARFDAVHTDNTVLTASPPSAFGFLSNTPASVSFEGSGSEYVEKNWNRKGISVPEGETISVIGGEINITNFVSDTFQLETRLRAPGGRINIASAASAGEFVFNDFDSDASFFEKFGDITLSGGSKIDVSGNQSGEICIRGGRFVVSGGSGISSETGDRDGGGIDIQMSDSLKITNGGYIYTTTKGDGRGSDISISSEVVEVIDGGKISADSGTKYYLDKKNIRGDGGDIKLDGNRVEIRNGALSTTAFDRGKGGDISVSADVLTIAGGGILTTTVDEGRGGDISISSEVMEFTDNGAIFANSGTMDSFNERVIRGDGGDIKLNGNRIEIRKGFVSTTAFNRGKGGDISVSADVLTIAGGGILTTTYSDGRGGDISISADVLKIVSNNDIPTSSEIVSDGEAEGDDGDIKGGILATVTLGNGDAGDILISAETVHISERGLLKSDSGTILIPENETILYGTVKGSSGNIILDTNHLEIKRGEISTNTLGMGDAGDLSVSADTVNISEGGVLKSDSGTILDGTVIGGKGTGGDVTLDTNHLEIKGGEISTNTLGTGKAGDISIFTDDISITDDGVITGDNGFRDKNGRTFAGGKGDSGDITLNVNRLEMDKGSVSSNNLGDADSGGRISITAAESVRVAGSGTDDAGEPVDKYYGIASQARGAGNGGHIIIKTDELHLTKDAMINGQTYGSGRGGDITLNVSSLEVSEGGTITTSTRGAGRSGDISITAGESVNVSGAGVKTDKSYVYAATHSGGNGGNVSISTPVLTIGKDGKICTETLGDDTEDGNTLPDGRAGDIELTADRIELSAGGLVTAGSKSEGDAGNISIDVKDTFSIDNASIETNTEQSDGGDISINVSGTLHLTKGSITTSVEGGMGNGGNITVGDTSEPEFAILKKNSLISADAHGGDGGNITIITDHFIKSSDSKLDASSELGIDGSVYIESPDEDISSSLTVLPDNFPDASRWMKTPCAERSAEKLSRFVVSGRDGIPAPLDDFLASPPFEIDRADRKKSDFSKKSDFCPQDLFSRAKEFYRKGNFGQAAKLWEQSIGLLNMEKHTDEYTDILEYLISAYQSLGQYKKALSLLEPALTIAGKSGNNLCDALIFSCIGDLYLSIGDIEKAEEYLEKGMKTALLTNNPHLLASVLNNLGNVLAAYQDYEEAVKAYEESLEYIGSADTTYEIPLHELKSKVLINLLRVRFQSNADEITGAEIENALRQITGLPDSHNKAADLISLCVLAQKIPLQNGGFVSEKTERFRSLVYEGLNEAKRIAEVLQDTRITSYACGYLGQFHEMQEHYSEAVRLTRRAIFFARQTRSPEILYLWQQQLGRLFKAEGNIEKAVKTYQHAVSALDPVRTEFYTGYRVKKNVFYEKVKPVYLELTALLLEQAENSGSPELREKKLIRARDTVELLKKAELQDFFQDECITQKKITVPDHTDPHTAVIYPVLLPDSLALLLVLPDGMKQINTSVPSETVRKNAKRFRRRLDEEVKMNDEERDKRSLHYAKELYDCLIRPVENELTAREIDTLVIAPDGALRLIPFSALYDREKECFLIEKYAAAIIPGITLIDSEPAEPGNARVLLSGLSESREEFPPLPDVPGELENIRAVTGGSILLDKDYTTGNLTREFRNHAYTVVHMATHGEFGAAPQDIFLLTYDEKLTMGNLEQLIGLGRFRDEQVALLTLSACQTALGDERAGLGLAGAALKAGAKSVIATLWSVYDESASLVITEFYRQLGISGISKAKALQNAQKKFIVRSRYEHPAYWAPFLLVGNWGGISD